jgi:hypothetical protein
MSSSEGPRRSSSAYDLRQLASMRHQMDAYRRGVIDLVWLISSLESLYHLLQDVPADWRDRFWSRWGVLEEIYSLSVVREKPLSPVDRADVAQAVEDLDAMVVQALPN